MNGSAARERGFALPELVCALVIAAVVVAVLALAGDGWRRNGRIGRDLANLRTIYAGQMSYAADSADKLPTFSWQANVNYNTGWGDINVASSALDAAVHQMIYIVRTRGGRTAAETPVIANLLAHSNYSQLVLCDYLNLSVPNRLFVSAGDRNRLLWADDPRGYDQGLYTPNLGVGGINWRHPYTTSFVTNTYIYDLSASGSRIYPSSTSQYYVLANTVLGGQTTAAIVYPSQKVLLHDRFARFFGPRLPFCTNTEARLPFLFGDGAVAVRSANEANLGADPNTGMSYQLSYVPTAIEPPVGGANFAEVPMRFMWTRGRIGGRDFGGPEAPQ
jgi:prepilin-type N-terminal cleavage/methylation domain-containing protein